MADTSNTFDPYDWMDDSMPTIPKHPVDTHVAKAVEGHQMDLFPGYSTATKTVIADNLETMEERGVDMVNLPAHYARFKIEPIHFMVENFGPGILVGKVIKYSMRYDAKNGLEDLAKAARCLHMLTEYVKGNPDWWKREPSK